MTNDKLERVAAKLRAEAAALAEMPDDQIDCSDIPETADWSNARRGQFLARPPSKGSTNAE